MLKNIVNLELDEELNKKGNDKLKLEFEDEIEIKETTGENKHD